MIVAVMIGLRFAVWYGAGVGGWVDSSVFTTFIVLAVFVSAILLQGVVQDFKESEKMPSELQGAFWSLSAEVEKLILSRPKDATNKNGEVDSWIVVKKLLACVIAVLDSKEKSKMIDYDNRIGGLDSMKDFEQVSSALRESEVTLFCFFKDLGAKPKKLSKPLEIIRKIIGRMQVIQDTSYIPACYSLMDIMVLAVFVLMTITDWPMETSFETAIAYTTIITFLFSFLWLMVRSLEDPFEYPHFYNTRCFNDSRTHEMSLSEEFHAAGSIDMTGLTVAFGKRLTKEECGARPRDPPEKGPEDAAGYPAFLQRWDLFVRSLPAVACAVGLRFAVWFGGGVGGMIDPQAFLSFISLTVFVSALMLQGLIQDYKESERMPSELWSAFEALTVAAQAALYFKAADDEKKAREEQDEKKRENLLAGTERLALYAESLQCIEKMLLSVLQVLDSTEEAEPAIASKSFHEATLCIRDAEAKLMRNLILGKGFDLITSVIKPIAAIRGLTARINIIKKTSYILAGYSLVDTMVLMILVLMTLSDWPYDTSCPVALAYTVVITLLFSYLALLIRRLIFMS